MFGRSRRKFERSPKPRVVVGQHQLAAMQVGDGVGQRKAEACPRRAAARIEPNEAPPRLSALVWRDSGSAIPDLNARLIPRFVCGKYHLTALARVFDCILDQVAEGLGEQLPVAHHL